MPSLSTDELLSEARELADRIHELFNGSSLALIGAQLEDALLGVVDAVENGHPNQHLRDVIAAVQSICRALPTSFGARFSFDIGLTDAIRNEWEAAGVPIFHIPVPRHRDAGWATGRIVMPTLKGRPAHSIRVITFPGHDRPNDVDLRDYPWLFHEMAHDLFYHENHAFRGRCGAALDRRIQALKLRAAADRGAMERLSSSHMKQLEDYWKPRLDQHDWAHEIASDVAAVRAVGPAFISCIAELLDRNPGRSFNAADQHPPYLTRAAAVKIAASHLGWSEEAWVLEEQISATLLYSSGDRGFLQYGDASLIQAAVDAALEACDLLKVPQMTRTVHSKISALSQDAAAELEGTALIAAGSLWASRLSRDQYKAWIEKIVRKWDATLQSP